MRNGPVQPSVVLRCLARDYHIQSKRLDQSEECDGSHLLEVVHLTTRCKCESAYVDKIDTMVMNPLQLPLPIIRYTVQFIQA